MYLKTYIWPLKIFWPYCDISIPFYIKNQFMVPTSSKVDISIKHMDSKLWILTYSGIFYRFRLKMADFWLGNGYFLAIFTLFDGMITCRFALILAFEVQTHSTKPRAGFIIRVVVSSLFYRLKCINISSILITFISIGCVTMTFVFSRIGFGMFRGINAHWNLPPKFSKIYPRNFSN